MFKTKLKVKKVLLGFIVTASLSLGGITAFAATQGPTLTAAGPVDISKMNVQMGTVKVVKELDPNLLEGLTVTTTSANATLEAVSSSKLDIANVQKGQIKIFKKLDPKKITIINNGQSVTAAKK